MDRIAEAKREAQQEVRTLPSSTPTVTNDHISAQETRMNVLWNTTLDATLLKFVPQADFDFDKVARALKSAILRGKVNVTTDNHGATIASPSNIQDIAESMTSENCRLRYTILTNPSSSSVALTTTTIPVSESTNESSPMTNGIDSTIPSPPLPPSTVPNDTVNDTANSNVRYQVRAGTGVGLRAPQVVTSNTINSSSTNGPKSYASWIPTTSKKDYAAAATTAALLAEAVTTTYDGQENNIHHLPIKPLSELIQGDFSLDHFRDYVRPTTELPSVFQGSQKFTRILHQQSGGTAGTSIAVANIHANDDDEDDDDDEEEPVSREDILRSLRGQGNPSHIITKSTKDNNKNTNIPTATTKALGRYGNIQEEKVNDDADGNHNNNSSGRNTVANDETVSNIYSSTVTTTPRTTVTNVDDLD